MENIAQKDIQTLSNEERQLIWKALLDSEQCQRERLHHLTKKKNEPYTKEEQTMIHVARYTLEQTEKLRKKWMREYL